MNSLKLLRVCAHKCLRFKLSSFETIDVSMSKSIQVVVGSNGSGKTTFSRICCSPLPPPRKAFAEGGFLKRTFLFNGQLYQINFFNDKEARHEFIDGDGNNRNPGGTETVQYALVKEVFGIDQELFNLFTGSPRERFHTMSPQRRREWITRIANADFDYAVSLYERVVSALRDSKGALKHQQSVLAKARLDAPETDVSELRAKVRTLTQDIDALYSRRVSFDPSVMANTMQALMKSQRELIAVIERADLKNNGVRGHDLGSPENLSGLTEEAKKAYSYLSGSYDVIASGLHAYEQRLEKLRKVHRHSPEVLNARISRLGDYTSRIEGKWSEEYTVEFILSLDGQMLKRAFGALMSSHSAYRSNRLELSSEGTVDEITAKLEAARIKEDRLKTKIGELDHLSKNLCHSKETECPKCQSALYIVDGAVSSTPSDVQAKRVDSELSQLYSDLDRTQTEITRLVEELGYRRRTDASEREVNDVFREYGELAPIWRLMPPVGSADFLELCSNVREKLRDHFALRAKYRRANAVIKTLSDQLAARLSTDSSLKLIEEETTAYRQKVETTYAEMLKSKAEYTALVTCEKTYQKLADAAKEAIRLQEEAGKLRKELCDQADIATEQAEIESSLRSKQGALGLIEIALTEHELKQNHILYLEGDIERLTKRVTDLGVLATSLSPSEGLVADQINAFVGGFVKAMNSVISRVWGYSLEVLPCQFHKGKLNYLFPLRVGDKQADAIDDVREGSTSQRDIVDHAFVKVAYAALGMTRYPVWFDEFGTSFDPLHRRNVIGYVESQIDVDDHSQVILASNFHDASACYGDSQTLVIEDRNIDGIAGCNAHVIFS